MSIYDLKWSNDEKRAARKAFDNAYQREMEEIKSLFLEKVSKIKNNTDLWAIEEFLSNKRRVLDKKYDFRYSQLILVFSHLQSEGYLVEEDVKDLDDEKKELIKNLSTEK
jgi:Photoprotection regulator fluorescence recovery protein